MLDPKWLRDNPEAMNEAARVKCVGSPDILDSWLAADARGKPFGAIGANVYSFVGPASPTDAHAYHYEGMATRTTADIIFPNTVASGATVWLSASWVSARGQTSVGSVPISFTLQGGAIPAAA